jgi:hypothetical protein
VNEGQDLLKKGFDLAYFIIPDRGIAVQILSNAMSKLRAQRSREAKRAYWRDKYLKGKITRIVREEGDTLQWLIYFEAEPYEKQQERSARQTTRDMVVRYIKHLVQITTAMSSFYVNVGFNRLLRNYSTPEARQVYEWMTQHYPGDQEYRKVKSALMARLKARFSNFLRTCTAPYGELRFETSEGSASWAELVDKCLAKFVPWSTTQFCQYLAMTTPGAVNVLSGKGRGSIHQDVIEMNRCHACIDPICYDRITKTLGLDAPGDKLALPRFFMNSDTNQEERPDSSGSPAKLSESERDEINHRLSLESERRRRISPRVLKIVVGGLDCARIDAEQRGAFQCQIDEGTKLIEIWAEDEGEQFLWATHWIEYTQSQGIAPAAATVDLQDQRELLLEIVPMDRAHEAAGAQLWLKCRPSSLSARWRATLSNRLFWFHVMPRYASVPLLFLGIGWLVANFKYSRDVSTQRGTVERLRKDLREEKAARESLQKRLETQQGPASVQSYLFVPDEIRTRGGDGTGEPAVTLSPGASQVILELPTPGGLRTAKRVTLKPFLENRQIIVEDFSQQSRSLKGESLQFVLPASFIETGKHYILELDSISRSGRVDRISTFTFYVAQK